MIRLCNIYTGRVLSKYTKNRDDVRCINCSILRELVIFECRGNRQPGNISGLSYLIRETGRTLYNGPLMAQSGVLEYKKNLIHSSQRRRRVQIMNNFWESFLIEYDFMGCVYVFYPLTR